MIVLLFNLAACISFDISLEPSQTDTSSIGSDTADTQPDDTGDLTDTADTEETDTSDIFDDGILY